MWHFLVDQDDLVVPKGPVGTEENVRLALETLIIPFGTRAEIAEIYLREWRTMWQDLNSDYTLGTSSATAKRMNACRVEIGDLYGQFKTCVVGVEEFELALECLIKFLRKRNAQS